MDRNYIIYNNHPFTLIWRLAKKECRRFFVCDTLCLSFRGYPPRLFFMEHSFFTLFFVIQFYCFSIRRN